jgi:hypothetical protein
LLCRAAHATYEANRAKERKAGNWNGRVDAGPSRMHIRALGEAGFGWRSLADAAGLSASLVFMIKQGTRIQVRKATELAILAVDDSARADCSLVDAGPTWALLDELRAEGFTMTELALRMGLPGQLEVSRDRVRAKTALRIRRFYDGVMAEAAE